MRSHPLVPPGFGRLLALGVALLTLPFHRPVEAAAPVVTLGPAGAKIHIASSSLSEAIDALARAASFKVTYEGPRPTAMLYNAEIDTPTVAQTLFRLIDGQNLNYAVMFDLSGKKVTKLMVLGTQPKTGGAASGAVSRPQAFTPPRSPRADMPVVEDDPLPAEPEPTPQPSPSPSPIPSKDGQAAPPGAPYSPFGPRPPFGGPFGPRPTPSPSP